MARPGRPRGTARRPRSRPVSTPRPSSCRTAAPGWGRVAEPGPAAGPEVGGLRRHRRVRPGSAASAAGTASRLAVPAARRAARPVDGGRALDPLSCRRTARAAPRWSCAVSGQRGGANGIVHSSGAGGPAQAPGRPAAASRDEVAQLGERRPLQRLGRERLAQQPAQRLLDAGEVVLAAADPVHDRHRRALAVRRTPGRRERPRSRPRRARRRRRLGVVAVQDLRGEVAGRAEQPAGLGEPRVLGDPGQAEVDEDRRAALHQHVGRLDVAVQHADRVHRLQRLGQAVGEVQQVGARRSAPPRRTWW